MSTPQEVESFSTAGGTANPAGRYITAWILILGSATEAQSVMERVRVSQPAEMYWLMEAMLATFFFCSWARVLSRQASRIRRRIRGNESLRFFMAVGSQHHNADVGRRKYSIPSS